MTSKAQAAADDPTGAVKMLTPGEVAALIGVNPKTVSRWAKAGKLPSVRTLGGHRRYREDDVRAAIRPDRP
jgi:excisionase family DNA binding protein